MSTVNVRMPAIIASGIGQAAVSCPTRESR